MEQTNTTYHSYKLFYWLHGIIIYHLATKHQTATSATDFELIQQIILKLVSSPVDHGTRVRLLLIILVYNLGIYIIN